MKLYEKYIKQQIREHLEYKPIKEWSEYKGSKNNEEAIRWVKELDKKGLALDLGCGEGYHTVDLVNICGDAVGIDIDKRKIEKAHEYGRPYCFLGDMHWLPFDDNAFDLIFSHEVIEHCAYPDKVFGEMRRVLKPDGSYVFTIPLEGHWKTPLNNNLLEKFDWKEKNQTHFWRPTAKHLYDTLKRNGFEHFVIKLYKLGHTKYKEDYEEGKEIRGYRPHAFVVVVS